MPRLLDTSSRTATLVAAVNLVLMQDGPAGLTLRRLARVSGVSTSSMLHHLGSREHLLRVAARSTSDARLDDCHARLVPEGPLAFLPRGESEVEDVRIWLGWQEIARSNESVAAMFSRVPDDERALMARAVEHQLVRRDLDVVLATVTGLAAALCHPTSPLPVTEARDVLVAVLARYGFEVPAAEVASSRSWWTTASGSSAE